MNPVSVPRTFVQLLSIFNISGVWDVAQGDLYCKSLWSVLKKNVVVYKMAILLIVPSIHFYVTKPLPLF
jgi:hypothetical protein